MSYRKLKFLLRLVCFTEEKIRTASVAQWSESLAEDTEVPGSIPGVTTLSD
jgi:hypothetical protein